METGTWSKYGWFTYYLIRLAYMYLWKMVIFQLAKHNNQRGYRGARHSIVDGTQVVAIGVRHAVLEETRPAALKMQPFKGKNICAECRRNQEKYGYNLNMDIIWYDDTRGLPFFVAVAGPGHIWCLDLNLGLGWVWGPPGVFSGGSLGLAFAPPWGCWFYGGSCMLAVF